MILALTVLHLCVCFFLILVVLLQTGKGADLAGAFGVGGSQTAFGARGAATLLSKLTTISAIVFMITSFTLAIFANKQGGTVVGDEPSTQGVPAVPSTIPEPQPTPTEGAAGDQGQPAQDSAQPPAGDPAADPNQS